MQLVFSKAVLAMFWVSTGSVAGIAEHATSFWVWIVLAAVAVFPSLVMMRRWNDPGQSMSQSIQAVIR